MERIIKLSSFFNSSSLDTRDEVVALFAEVRTGAPSNKLIFDFTGIEFISRSFADEFHKQKMQLAKELNMQFEVANADLSVIEMLQAVSHTQHKVKREESRLMVYSFKDTASLFNYLQAV